MDVSRTIDPDRHFIYTTVTGEITLAEIYEDMVRLASDPNYQPEMTGIVDMRNATVELTADELRQLAGELRNRPKVVARARRALLVGSDLAFGIYRMFATLAMDGSTDYRVFRDEQAARDWLKPAVRDEGPAA
jgi:hypothetical protein